MMFEKFISMVFYLIFDKSMAKKTLFFWLFLVSLLVFFLMFETFKIVLPSRRNTKFSGLTVGMLAHVGLKVTPSCPKLAPVGAHLAQVGPKLTPSCPQDGQCWLKLASSRTQVGPC